MLNPILITTAVVGMATTATLLIFWTIAKAMKPLPRPPAPPAPTWPYVFEPAVYPPPISDLEAARRRNLL